MFSEARDGRATPVARATSRKKPAKSMPQMTSVPRQGTTSASKKKSFSAAGGSQQLAQPASKKQKLGAALRQNGRDQSPEQESIARQNAHDQLPEQEAMASSNAQDQLPEQEATTTHTFSLMSLEEQVQVAVNTFSSDFLKRTKAHAELTLLKVSKFVEEVSLFEEEPNTTGQISYLIVIL